MENKTETITDINSNLAQADKKSKAKRKIWLWVLIPAILTILIWLFLPLLRNKLTLDCSSMVQSNTSSDEKFADTSVEMRDFSTILTNGAWYEYGYQDIFAYEWIFYDDGTCTRKMRLPGEARDEYIYTDKFTYSVEGNEVAVYSEEDDVNGYFRKWRYDENKKCCWYYFDMGYDGSGIYKLKIFRYDQKLTQAELDQSFERNADEYLFNVDDTYKEY